MKRISILLVAAALGLAACGEQASTSSAAPESTPVATPQPTAEPTAEPTVEPASSADAGNSGTALAELLPDSLDGRERADVDMATNPMFAQAIGQSGVDASEVEFLISTYGTGTDALGVTSMRIPEMGQVELEQLARLMSGMSDGQGSAESVTVGGKQVLQITAAQEGGTGYMYFADGAVFIVAGGDEDLAAELLSQLP